MKTGVFIFKKLFFTILFLLCLLGLFICLCPKYILNLNDEKSITVYEKSYSSNAKEGKTIMKDFNFTFNFTGMSFYLEEGEALSLIEELNCKVVLAEKIEEGVSLYMFSEKIPLYKNINGKKVNVHIFYSESYIKAGIPLIYGSF